VEGGGSLFQLIICILGFPLFVRIRKVLSQPFKHMIRANEGVERLTSPLRAEEFSSPIFGAFVDVIYYITVSIKIVAVTVELSFYKITLLLEGRITPVV